MLMFLDLESSGLIKRDLPLGAPEQPWIVGIACELTDLNGTHIASIDTAIRANGRSISDGARRVHGVTSAHASRSGISEIAALGVLCGKESFASQAKQIIGHNAAFDCQVIESVLLQNGREASALKRPGLTIVDTMLAATPFCKIPSEHESGGYKFASLDEACQILLCEPPRQGHHTAWEDLQRAKRLYFLLRERGAFEVAA